MNMNVVIDDNAIKEIKSIMEDCQADESKSIRIYNAKKVGSPSFGIALDKQNENDVFNEIEGIKFVMEKETFDKYGDIKIELMGAALKISAVNKAYDTGCEGCDGSCCSSCGLHK
jgi:Fe-S cluster assembly iron-binding protein IscA